MLRKRIRLGPMSIHLERNHVQVGGYSATLTPIEIRLLVYLAANHGRTISYTQLVKEICQETLPEHQAYGRIGPHFGELHRKLKPAENHVLLCAHSDGLSCHLN